ncbi:MAG: hypothetical protein IPO09_01830 [Anaeromyxobacter sp.]|nr:hypothetical protein [Anaeromyxobacter sp.]MBL0278101.1 hypothetical protein [Anaeromyxobacter sp.]
MRQVRVQGCLPTLAVLLLVAALAAVAFTAGLAVVLATAGFLVVLAVVRAVRRLMGGQPGPGRGGGPQAGRAADQVVEALPPGWIEREPGGPVVEAGPRQPADGPERDGERPLPPRE